MISRALIVQIPAKMKMKGNRKYVSLIRIIKEKPTEIPRGKNKKKNKTENKLKNKKIPQIKVINREYSNKINNTKMSYPNNNRLQPKIIIRTIIL